MNNVELGYALLNRRDLITKLLMFDVEKKSNDNLLMEISPQAMINYATSIGLKETYRDEYLLQYYYAEGQDVVEVPLVLDFVDYGKLVRHFVKNVQRIYPEKTKNEIFANLLLMQEEMDNQNG